VFSAAGRTLARGVAMMQALMNPDRYLVLGPAALVDGATPASAAFLAGLDTAHEFVGFGGLWPAAVVARSTTGALGAVAAAVAALRASHPATTGNR
jgi:predicted NBD/HSP70 family sugar kinase